MVQLKKGVFNCVFLFSMFILMLEFFLCLIWLPIAVHNTYGFRSAKFVFTSTFMYNKPLSEFVSGWSLVGNERQGTVLADGIGCRRELLVMHVIVI